MKSLYFQWHITDACNFRCRHCYQDNFNFKNDLDFSSIVKVWQNILNYAKNKNFNVSIAITGGEPFLRKDIFNILSYLDSQDILKNLFIISNLSLVNKDTIEKLKSLKKLKQIKTSLDGATKNINDNIRGYGSFNMVLEKIKLLKENNFKVGLLFTLMKSNIFNLDEIFKISKSISIDSLILERFIPLGNSKSLTCEVIDKIDWYNILKNTFEYFGYSIDFDIYPIKAVMVKIPENKIFVAYCNLSLDSFAILPKGDLLPCRRFNLVIGNLLKENFFEIIKNYDKLFSYFTDKRNLKGKCKNCIYNCFGCRALSYALYNDYLEEDFQCNK